MHVHFLAPAKLELDAEHEGLDRNHRLNAWLEYAVLCGINKAKIHVSLCASGANTNYPPHPSGAKQDHGGLFIAVWVIAFTKRYWRVKPPNCDLHGDLSPLPRRC